LALERKNDNQPQWYEDGPSLPVEFARQSSKSRITLVIIPEKERPTQPRIPVLWAYSSRTNLDTARENLRCREGRTPIKNIGVWPPENGEAFECIDLIGDWAKSKNIDGVVWTALKPKFDNFETIPTSGEVLKYLEQLRSQHNDGSAKEYICKAPPQIRTPYRADIEKNFGWNYDASTG
jgi:hypothetical protein